MSLSCEPLHPLFAARMTGIDLRQRPDAARLRAFVAAMGRYGVGVVGHDEPLTDEQHIAFSALLGPIERGPVPKVAGTGQRVPHSEIIDQSNLDQDGAIYRDDDRRLLYKRANRLWHTDMSFYPVRATWSLLSANAVPPAGGETEFADMRAAYEALPEKLRATIDGLDIEHCYWHSRVLGGGPEPSAEERRTRPPARHRLVHTHEGSGRKALYLASHARAVVGWPADEGRALLDELMERATRPRFVYRHTWRRGEVVIWDNLCTMHRATPFDDTAYRRDMRRTTCRESEVGAASGT